MGGQQATRQEPLGTGIPASHQPLLNRNREAALGAERYALSDSPPRDLPQHGLEPSAAHPDLVWQRRREFPDILVKKWRPRLQGVEHRSAIDLGHVLAAEAMLPLVGQHLAEEVAGRLQRFGNGTFLDGDRLEPGPQHATARTVGQARVGVHDRSQAAGGVVEKMCRTTNRTAVRKPTTSAPPQATGRRRDSPCQALGPVKIPMPWITQKHVVATIAGQQNRRRRLDDLRDTQHTQC